HDVANGVRRAPEYRSATAVERDRPPVVREEAVMSLLGGFDLMLELDRAAALRLIMNSTALLSRPLLPPFEVTMPLGSNTSDRAHLLVRDVTLDLPPGSKQIGLGLLFQNSRAYVKGVVVPRLAGAIFIRANLQIVPVIGTRFVLVRQGVRDVTVGLGLGRCDV